MCHTQTDAHSFLQPQWPHPRNRHIIIFMNDPKHVSYMYLSHSNMLHALPEAALHQQAVVLVQFQRTTFLLIGKNPATSLNLNMWLCFNKPHVPTPHIARYMAEWMKTIQGLHIHDCDRDIVLTVRFNNLTYHCYWQ